MCIRDRAKAVAIIGLAILLAKSFEVWRTEQRKPWLVAAAVSLAAIAFLNRGLFPILLQGTALPIIASTILLIAGYSWFRTKERNRELELVIAWVVMSGLLMAKFPLRATVMHYGFVLSMPIVLLAIAWSLERLPNLLCKRTGGTACGAFLCIMLMTDVFGSGAMTATNVLSRKQSLGPVSYTHLTLPTICSV